MPYGVKLFEVEATEGPELPSDGVPDDITTQF